MKKFLTTTLVNGLSLWIIDALFTGIAFPDTLTLIVTAAILGLLNSTVKPVLQLLCFPLSVFTLGLFYLVVNGLVLSFAMRLSGGYVSSLSTAVFAAIVLSITNSGFSGMLQD